MADLSENPFLILKITPTLAPDPLLLEQGFIEASKAVHPDNPQGETGKFASLGTARTVLANLSTRIPAALEALGYDAELREYSSADSHMVPMSSELVALFAELGPAIQRVTSIARKKTSARSELARALLAREELAARKLLETTGSRIDKLIDGRSDRLVELDRLLSSSPRQTCREALRIASDCAFLEKWKAQVRASLASLFV